MSEPPEGSPPYGPPPEWPPMQQPAYPPPHYAAPPDVRSHPQQHPPQWAEPWPPSWSQQWEQQWPQQWPQQAPAPVRPAFPHPEPREYHLMYRTWTYRWWRPVVGIVLLALGMLVVMPLLMLPVLAVGVLVEGGEQGFWDTFRSAGTLETITPSGLLYLNLTLAGLILWTWGLVRFLHQMRPRWLASVVPKLRWSFLFTCVGLAFIALVAQLLVGLLVPQSGNPDVTAEAQALTGTTVALGVVVLLTTPLQAVGEEYAFRGYLLQAVGSLSRRRWVALVVTATLFAMAHGLQNPPLFFDRFMFGMIAGWLVIRTGGLEAGIAMHVLNNYLAFGLALAFGNIDDTLTVSEISWWNVPVTLTQSLVYAGLVVWVTKRMKLRNVTRPPATPALL